MREGTLHNKNDDSVKEWGHFLKARKPENQKTRPGRASFPETVKTQKKQFDAAFGGWGTGADPDTSENIWGSGQARNFVNYKNPLVDELFEEGRKLPAARKQWKDLGVWKDPELRAYLKIDPKLAEAKPTREDCYAAIHAVLWRDQPYTWLFCRSAFEGLSKRLRGYNFSPRGIMGYGPGFGSIWVPQTD